MILQVEIRPVRARIDLEPLFRLGGVSDNVRICLKRALLHKIEATVDASVLLPLIRSARRTADAMRDRT